MSFCTVPWTFQAIKNNGDVRVCCQMNSGPGLRGVLYKPDGSAYNASTDSLRESRNADFIRDVRASMMRGEWHPSCVRCEREEASGIESKRIMDAVIPYNRHITPESVQEYTGPDGTLNLERAPDVVHYDLRFGNLCNLKCTMCGPRDSHQWYEDHVALHGTTHWQDQDGTRVELKPDSKGRLTTDYYDWHYKQNFWDELTLNIPTMRQVYMAGGEPLLIDSHYDFLERCIELGRANKIIIEYNTNLTVLPQRARDLWQHFKRVRLGVSLDGIGAHLEYQRFPAKWDAISANLQIIEQLPDNCTARLSATITPYTVWHMPDFMYWKLTQGFTRINPNSHAPIISYHPVHKPMYNNITVLLPELKEQLTQHYEQAKTMFTQFSDNEQHHVYKILDSISNFAHAQDNSHLFYSDFVKTTQQLDRLRNKNILDIEPRYTQYFN